MKSPSVRSQLQRLTAIFVCFTCFSSCKPKNQGHLKGAIFDNVEAMGLMHVIHQREISVCVIIDQSQNQNAQSGQNQAEPGATPTIVPSNTVAAARPADGNGKPSNTNQNGSGNIPLVSKSMRSQYESKIRNGLAVWTKEVEVFTGKPVISNIRFLHEEDGCKPPKKSLSSLSESPELDPVNEGIAQLSVALTTVDLFPGGRLAFVIPHTPGQLWMVLGSRSDDGVIIHELGHSLGLDHTRKSSGESQGIMNAVVFPWNGHLYPDDVQTMQYAYCRVYAQNRLDICTKLNPNAVSGKFPRIGNDGKFMYTLESLEGELEDSNYFSKEYASSKRQQSQSCVRIKSVAPGGNLDQAGVTAGDCLISLGYSSTPNLETLTDVLSYNSFPDATDMNLLPAGTDTFIFGTPRKDAKVLLKPMSKQATYTKVQPANAKSDTYAVGNVVKTIASTNLVTSQNQMVTTIPKDVSLTVLEVKTSPSGLWLRVNYFEYTGWINAAKVKQDTW